MISDAALAGEITEIVSCSEAPLTDALAVVRAVLGVDRVSLSRIDDRIGTFTIVATAGAALLVPGTELPLEVSSYFDVAARGEVFDAPDFRAGKLTRPLDEVVAVAGFSSGAALPLRRGTSVVGAVALSGRKPESLADRVPGQLAATTAVLTMAMREVTSRAPLCLILIEDPIAAEGVARLVERAIAARSIICASVDAAVAAIEHVAPSVIVVDDHVDGGRCDQVVGQLRRAGAAAPVVVLATHDTSQNLLAALDAGVAGYVPRHAAGRSFAGTLHSVLAGRTVLPSPDVTQRADRLTPRELEVLSAFDDGLAVRQVARRLGISEPTTKSHTRNLLRKLGAHSRIEALTLARREGYLPPR